MPRQSKRLAVSKRPVSRPPSPSSAPRSSVPSNGHHAEVQFYTPDPNVQSAFDAIMEHKFDPHEHAIKREVHRCFKQLEERFMDLQARLRSVHELLLKMDQTLIQRIAPDPLIPAFLPPASILSPNLTPVRDPSPLRGAISPQFLRFIDGRDEQKEG